MENKLDAMKKTFETQDEKTKQKVTEAEIHKQEAEIYEAKESHKKSLESYSAKKEEFVKASGELSDLDLQKENFIKESVAPNQQANVEGQKEPHMNTHGGNKFSKVLGTVLTALGVDA